MSTILRVPHRQHTTAKVVLRQFAWKNLLTVFDREKDIICSKGPNGVFFVQDFDGSSETRV